jgi:hypothetical protein
MRQPTGSDPMGFWGNQPTARIELGRAWHQMPHRGNLLIFLGGGIIDALIADEAQWPFLAQLRSEWVSELNGEERPEDLRRQIERFNPTNYTFEMRDGKRVAVGFDWPETMARQTQEDLRRISKAQMVTSFPFQCRQLLDSEALFREEQLRQLAVAGRAGTARGSRYFAHPGLPA